MNDSTGATFQRKVAHFVHNGTENIRVTAFSFVVAFLQILRELLQIIFTLIHE
jgi:hypothetical protein